MQAAQLWQQWAMIKGLLEEQQQLELQQTAGRSTQQWQQPPSGYLKCNVDASFYNTTEASGWGWCLRDH
ncbi:hypothetical protein A2U01_0039148 [Trifolium medium]|uniref:Uncharacterized protein n=1 Tax=Trifolium medium TaxID=97028 RepID=A0A392Q1Y7_9FABA|nr:hypothetical protein [Trifolium medium]